MLPFLLLASAAAFVRAPPGAQLLPARRARAGRPAPAPRTLGATRMAAPLARLGGGDDEDDAVVIAEPVLAALERAGARARGPGARVTEADVAVSAGLSIDEARRELLALARVAGGELEVSGAGEILYSFPPGVRGALSAASGAARRREAWAVWQPRVAKAARVSFGAALFASLAIVTTALTVLSSSSSSSDDDRRGGGGGQRTVFIGNGFSPFDIWYYSQPRRYPLSPGAPQRMGFLEACFSLVFGDGDPNAPLQEARWRAVGALIREQGGAVTAEQLAPLLEPARPPAPDGTADGGSASIDESFVLPALTRFAGVPTLVTDEAGETRLVYAFPELASTAGGEPDAELAGALVGGALAELEVPFSAAGADQLAGAGALGVANLAAVITLGRALRAVRLAGGAAALAGNSAGLYAALSAAYPLLGAYAVLFVAAPVVRCALLSRRNEARAKRNALRAQWSEALARRTPQLARKLRAARCAAPEQRRISSGAAGGGSGGSGGRQGRSVTATDPTANGGAEAAEDLLSAFDERLKRRQPPPP